MEMNARIVGASPTINSITICVYAVSVSIVVETSELSTHREYQSMIATR